MRTLGIMATTLFVAALAPGAARTAGAQEVERSADGAGWTLDARGGLALAAGDLAEIEGTGPSFGTGIGYYIAPRISIRLDFGLNLLPGESTFFEAADLDAWHAQAGAAYLLTSPDAPLFVDVGGGAGVTVVSFDGDDDRGNDIRFGYSLVGRIGRAIASNADVALRSALQFVDVPEDTWTIWQFEAVLQLWN